MVLISLLVFAFSLWGQNLELSQTPIKVKIFDDFSDSPIRFDTTRIFPPPGQSGVFRDVGVGANFKGPADDTVRIFTVMSGAPYYAMLVNDTTTAHLQPTTLGWQRHGSNGHWIDSSGTGFWGATVGDVDGDGYTDMVYGENGSATSNCNLLRAYWDGVSWRTESLATFRGLIKDIAIGDADNNGSTDIVLVAGYGVFRVRRSGSVWLRDSLWAGSAICNGVAIGDCNPNYTGNEIILVTAESRILQIRWTGSSWNAWDLISPTNQVTLDDVAVGDFNPDSIGDEVVIINTNANFISYGNLFIFYLRGTSWNYHAFAAYFSEAGWGRQGEVAIGKVYELADHNQIVFTAGDAVGSDNYPIIFWRADDTYWIRAMPRTNGSNYGIAIGDVNRHRASLTQEMALTGNSRIYEYEQRLLYENDLTVSEISFSPSLIAEGDSAQVKIKIKNYGYNFQDTIPVFYRTDAKVVVAESCLTGLNLGDSTVYTFRQKYYCAGAGNVLFDGYTGLANEQYPWDDTTSNYLFVRTTLAGEKTVGAGGDFTTLSSALNYWNSSIIKGNVFFRLLDSIYNSETYSLALTTPVAYRDSIWSLTIKPQSTSRAQFRGANSGTMFEINGITKLSIDSVSIINNGSGAAVRFSNGACYNKIINSVLKGSCNTNTTGVVAFMGTNTSTGNNNNLIEDCVITKDTTYSPQYGIYFEGSDIRNQDNTIKRCQIYNFSKAGICLEINSDNTLVTESDIYTQDVQVSPFLYGVSIGDYTVAGTKITANKIHDLQTAQANAVIAGIYMYYGSEFTPTLIANNFIYLDATVLNTPATIYGIFEDSYYGVRIDIYFNSIYIGGADLSADKNSYGLYRNYACNMNFKNNIIFNNRSQTSNTGKHYAIYCNNTNGVFESNYNDLYIASAGTASGQLLGYWNGPCTTLQQWRASSNRDGQSISKNPAFIAANDLHINPFSPNVDRKALPISGITADIDNQARDANHPDIGADEYNINPPSAFNLISPVNNAVLVPINGSLIWHQSTAAEYYDVLLDTVNPPVQKVSALQPETAYYYTELFSLRDYYWQVKAFNDTNPGEEVTASAIWKFTTVPVPATPSNLVLANVYAEQASLSWTDNANDELGFYIKQDTSPNGSFPIVDSVNANTINYTAFNLTPNQRYWWRVCAYNQYGYRGYAMKDTTTLARVPGIPQLNNIKFQSIKFILNPLNNPPSTQFCVKLHYDAKTDKYLHPNGVLVDTAVWATYQEFGAGSGQTISGLYPNQAYTFSARGRNQNLIATNFGGSVTQTTLAPLTIYYTESFENQDYPPLGWTEQVIISGGTNWTRINNGTNPSQLPYHGQYQLKYNSYNASSGAHSRMAMPPINLNVAVRANLKFYMYHDNQTTNADSLVIESSIDNGLTWHRLIKFNRYAPTSAWQQHLVSLLADSGHVSQVAFHAYSGNGHNIFIDSIAIVPDQDVLVSTINRPDFIEDKRVGFAPQVTVINNSTQPQTIPVNAEIWTPAIGFNQGFENSAFPPSEWTVYNNDGGNQNWQRNTTSPYLGTGCAASVSEGAGLRNDDWLVMPSISINASDQLCFFCKVNAVANDSLEVWLSQTTNAMSSFNIRLDAFGVRTVNYTEKTVDLSSYNGQQVYLAFVNKSLNQGTVFLDAIRINYTEPVLVYANADTIENLGAGNTAPVSFDLWTPMIEGEYRFVSYIDLPSDMNSVNNYIEREFAVQPIPLNLTSPAPNQFTNDVTPDFDWQDITGATQYHIQIDNDSSFASPVINELLSNSAYTVDESDALADDTYFWRVRVELPAPIDPYSPSRRFMVDTEVPSAPVLISPVCSLATNNQQPTFIWQSVSGTDLFNLTISLGESTVVSVNIADTAHTINQSLNNGVYLWRVSAKDSAGNWSTASDSRVLFIDLVPPEIPNLILPLPNQIIPGRPQLLVWTASNEAVVYNVLVGPSEESYYTIDTSYQLNLEHGTYQWLVRARDSAGNWSDFSESRTFMVQTGWIKKADLPSKLATKFVKDGGSLVSAGDALFALRGNKSNEFYKYIIEDDTWACNLESIPYGRKITDPTKINAKKIGKGAALCYDGNSRIYATKGRSTYELWAYDINSDTWIFDTFVPTAKGLKGGTSIIYLNGKIYLLAGGQKKYQQNFYAYDPVAKIWFSNLDTAPMIPDSKVFKDGSCLAELNGTIYALKGGGKHNYFYAYDTSANLWTYLESESIPQVHPEIGKKAKVKDGGAMTRGNSGLYAIKGGKKNEFWVYQDSAWIPLEIIPKFNNLRNSLPKAGASLVYLDGKVYLLKGNNTQEFWEYIPSELPNLKTQISRISTTEQTEKICNPYFFNLNVSPNPLHDMATINFNASVNGKVRIRLYNASGRLTETFIDQTMTAGNYTINFHAEKFAKGVYFLKYENGYNRSEIKLIIR
jgi:hypothetical protein